MWDGFNKRKFPRLNLQCEIDIRSEEQKSPIHAITENIGIGGVCVLLDKSLERFSRCSVKIQLGKADSFTAEGKVVWIVPTQDSHNAKKQFDTGLEFVDLDEQQSLQLRQFIENELTGLSRS